MQAVERRDLRDAAWALIDAVLNGRIDTAPASTTGGLLRIIAALGPEGLAVEEALREVELRGRVVHGQPPRDAAQWELAARTFTAETLDELQRWEDEANC